MGQRKGNRLEKKACPHCGEMFGALGRHLVRSHGGSLEEYTLARKHGGIRPLCRCGCGQETPFKMKSTLDFLVYVPGHRPAGRPPDIGDATRRIHKRVACAICGRDFGHLARHVRTTHGMDFVQYQLDHVFGGAWPLCSCGCGRRIELTRGRRLTNRFISGHESRGRVLSKEHKEKIGKRSSKSLEKRWKEERPKMEEAQKAGQERMLERYSRDEWSEKASVAITKKYLEDGFSWSTGTYVSEKNGGLEIHYRSSWELMHIQRLEDDPSVVSYEYEPFSIAYIFEGKRRRYIPDFLVRFSDGRTELHEVGVAALKSRPREMAKRSAAEARCVLEGWSYVQVTAR